MGNYAPLFGSHEKVEKTTVNVGLINGISWISNQTETSDRSKLHFFEYRNLTVFFAWSFLCLKKCLQYNSKFLNWYNISSYQHLTQREVWRTDKYLSKVYGDNALPMAAFNLQWYNRDTINKSWFPSYIWRSRNLHRPSIYLKHLYGSN